MNGKIKDYVSRRLEEKQLSTLTFAEKIYSPSDNLLAFTCFLPIEDTMYKNMKYILEQWKKDEFYDRDKM